MVSRAASLQLPTSTIKPSRIATASATERGEPEEQQRRRGRFRGDEDAARSLDDVRVRAGATAGLQDVVQLQLDFGGARDERSDVDALRNYTGSGRVLTL